MATDITIPSTISHATVLHATRIRRTFAYLSSFLFLVTLVFLILVEIGCVSANRPVIPSIYFIKLDLTNIIPRSVPNFRLVNSIARTLGLHDFYQVGLWNYCAGYGDQVTECSKPQKLYWFNPVEILLSELLAGASIALPSQITDALDLVRTASRWMFVFFLTGACLTLPTALLAPLAIYTRWASFPLAILTFLTAFTTTVASVIATAMFLIFKSAVQSAAETVNIQAEIGIKMFVFMWFAAGAAILGSLIHFAQCCCCTSARDVRTGRRKGRRKAYRPFGRASDIGATGAEEKPRARRRWMGRSV
ncbi:MAG: hypothetical protein LQ337_007009 [Flavoplaca oasis]|nr:MAG: hypothetical protein LQ337_007009 [Flavoplaca oasis]